MDITFFGYFGVSNWGDDGTLLAMITRIREIDPGARLRCISTSPDVATTRLGVEMIPSGSNQARFWDRELPLVRRIPASCSRMVAEVAEWAHAFRALRDTEVLMVPGSGILTDAGGLHGFGPYSLVKWVLMARLRRAKVVLVSVGAGPINGAAGRVLIRISLSLASYRSYRDAESRDVLRGIGVRVAHDTVYPDLAFSLPRTTLPLDSPQRPGTLNGSPSADRRRVVGLGLMSYWSPYSGGDSTGDTYANYLDAMAAFARWLLERDYDVRLLLGDEDTRVIADFRSTFARSGDDGAERITYTPFTSVEDLLAAMAESDLVVATRFHNVLFAMVLQKPVIAITFHHKCTSLMSQMKLQRYCHDIHRISAAVLIEQFQSLEKEQDAVKQEIGAGVEDARAALDEQYDLVFTALR